MTSTSASQRTGDGVSSTRPQLFYSAAIDDAGDAVSPLSVAPPARVDRPPVDVDGIGPSRKLRLLLWHIER